MTGETAKQKPDGSKEWIPFRRSSEFKLKEAPDTVKPVITLAGTPIMNVAFGSTYTDPGATCTDNKDPTCTVVTTGTVDTSKAGPYTITYTAIDKA